jgi:hypothetical protein
MVQEEEVRRKSALAEARAFDGMAWLGLNWWETRRASPGALPGVVSSLPQPLALLIACSYLVAVAHESPARFSFVLTHHSGTDCPDVTTLGMFSSRLRVARKPLYDDLGFVAFSGTPSYQVVELGGPREGVVRRYRRLILPLSLMHSRVDQLLVLAETDRLPEHERNYYAVASSGSVTG